jgi:ketosteroid isomerase-like protein
VRLNDPAVVAEVRAAFDAYERALLANDVDALDGWFHDGPDVVRFIFGTVELGADAVSAARRAVPRQTGPRTIDQLEVRTWGPDVASVFAVCRLTETGAVVHQSQTWARLDAGWRVVAAHVSHV